MADKKQFDKKPDNKTTSQVKQSATLVENKRVISDAFASLIDDVTVNAPQEEKDKKLTDTESGLKDIQKDFTEQKKITNGLKVKVDKISKLLNSVKIKNLFKNATKLNKLANQKAIPEKNKAKKIEKLDGKDSAVDLLNKIYSFMQKNYDEDKRNREVELNFAKEQKLEKDRRNKEFLDALKKSRGGTAGKMDTGDEEDESLLSKLFGYLGNLGGFRGKAGKGKAGKGKTGKVSKVGKAGTAAGKAGAAAGKAGSGVAKAAGTATKVSKALSGAKGLLKVLKRVPLIGTIAAGVDLISSVSDAITEHEMGQIDDKELKKRIISAVGGALAGAGGATLGASIGATLGSVVPVVGTFLGGALGGVGGFFVGEKVGKYAAEKAFDYFTANPEAEPQATKPVDIKKQTATPVPTSKDEAPAKGVVSSGSSSAAPKPVASSAPPTATASSTSKPAVPTATVTTPPTAGAKLNDVTQQNVKGKLDEKLKDVAALAPVTSQVTNLTQQSVKSSSQKPLPAVRNQEETFQRMIYGNTRVV